MTKHPSNKFQRKLIEEKKHKFVDEKKAALKSQRSAKVRRKLSIESLKEQETSDELKRFTGQRVDNQPVDV
jgi:hypothetical protein